MKTILKHLYALILGYIHFNYFNMGGKQSKGNGAAATSDGDPPQMRQDEQAEISPESDSPALPTVAETAAAEAAEMAAQRELMKKGAHLLASFRMGYLCNLSYPTQLALCCAERRKKDPTGRTASAPPN